MPRPRKKKSAKWDRCVRKVKRRRSAVNAAAVCTAALSRRRPNPRHVSLYARPLKGRGPVLKYVGGIKFAKRGRPIKFDSQAHAMSVARELKAQFRILRKYRLWAA